MKIIIPILLLSTMVAISANQITAQSQDLKLDAINLFQYKNPKQLTDFYGSQNVKTENAYDYENNIIGMSVVIYPNSQNELKILFDSYESKFTMITIKNAKSQWKTPNNIKVGTTLNELIKINGKDFKINGFETDYGGTISTWDGGNLENSGVSMMLTPDPNSTYYKNYDKYSKVTGDNGFSTTNEIIKGLNLTVMELNLQNKK